jgi:uncharacterized protein (TIGR02284 family)
MTESDIISTLNDLIETSKDGQKGFMTSSEDANSAEIKQLLRQYSQECAAAVSELQELVRALGGDPEKTGSALGALHRGWVNLKAAVSSNDDTAILNEVERGEDVAKASYQKALEKDLPIDIRTVIQRQYEGVVRHHDHVRALRDQFRALKS